MREMSEISAEISKTLHSSFSDLVTPKMMSGMDNRHRKFLHLKDRVLFYKLTIQNLGTSQRDE